MSMPAAHGAHEFVVAPELAVVAKRLGVPLHGGDRVRFEVVEGERDATRRRRRLGWLGSVSTGKNTALLPPTRREHGCDLVDPVLDGLTRLLTEAGGQR